MDATSTLPLSGVRVLDFSRMIAGPYCAQELADFGAEVIKVESPEGDDSRRGRTQAEGSAPLATFTSANRSKKSVVLNLKTPAGQGAALALIRHADVVVENFTAGVMDRLGLGWDAVRADNPRLVYCSIIGYGAQDAVVRARPAYDGVLQAISGMMSVTGEAHGMPVRTPYAIIDVASGMTAASSVLAALLRRERLGRGERVEVALHDVAMAIMAPLSLQALASGSSPARMGSRGPQSAPSDTFATADGLLFITCGNDRLFRRLCVDALDAPALADHPDYATSAARARNVDGLTRELEAIFAREPTDFWMRRLDAAGVPAGPVHDVLASLRTPEALSAQTVLELPTSAGAIPVIRSPRRFVDAGALPMGAPPHLGEHTAEVLRDLLAYTDAQVAEVMAGNSRARA